RAQASPIVYVGPKTVPVFILHGDQDKTVDVSSARQLDEALSAAGVPHQTRIVPGAGHDPNSLEAMESIAEWLRERLK
ncbi:MAG: prolyl oligopeptidase family serine peptidase, partial [Planctomycetes bacterium]|nr:prolyl oligopeptidase family serine peptidase [Planctomycetota bacterium]